MSTASELRRTPLHQLHVEARARLVPFAGWEMPVQYAGVLAEHQAVRRTAGLFDVSHMGELVVRGPAALELLQHLTPNNVARLEEGQAHYTGLLTERGTFVDDLLIYRLAADSFFLVVNAARTDADLQWLRHHAGDGVEIQDVSADYALLALQGPQAAAVMAPIFGPEVTRLRPFRFLRLDRQGHELLISRTGYTGEDGFEVYLHGGAASELWSCLLESGAKAGVQPAGLAARDTLRLEAALCLYGQDIDTTTTPLEAGLDFIVKMEKSDFTGRAVLARQRAAGLARQLTGFQMIGRGIARRGHTVEVEGVAVGEVTSGSHSPTLGTGIGLVYLDPSQRRPGSPLTVRIRDTAVAASVVPLPFYRRPRV